MSVMTLPMMNSNQNVLQNNLLGEQSQHFQYLNLLLQNSGTGIADNNNLAGNVSIQHITNTHPTEGVLT